MILQVEDGLRLAAVGDEADVHSLPAYIHLIHCLLDELKLFLVGSLPHRIGGVDHEDDIGISSTCCIDVKTRRGVRVQQC